MTDYSRPPVTAAVFRDAAGEAIEYGERWGSGMPPDVSYSVTSNLERYLPLHTIAHALIAHLVENFDVTVSDEVAHAADLMHTRIDVIRAVQLTPANANEAPLTFVFTSFPSVIVAAGAVTQMLFPFCGCDACDEAWEYAATEMEWQVFAVAGGGLEERQTSESPPRFTSGIEAADGSAKRGLGDVMTEMATPERIRSAVTALAVQPNGWAPWAPKN